MLQRNLVIAMLFVSGSQGALVAEGGHTIEGLGAVSFPVSCRPELRRPSSAGSRCCIPSSTSPRARRSSA